MVLVNGLVTILRSSRYGPLLYIVADTVRPLTFFPDSLMTIAGGMLFGPLGGSIYSLIGASTSATTAYLVGKNLSGRPASRLQRERLFERFRQNYAPEAFRNGGAHA